MPNLDLQCYRMIQKRIMLIEFFHCDVAPSYQATCPLPYLKRRKEMKEEKDNKIKEKGIKGGGPKNKMIPPSRNPFPHRWPCQFVLLLPSKDRCASLNDARDPSNNSTNATPLLLDILGKVQCHYHVYIVLFI